MKIKKIFALVLILSLMIIPAEIQANDIEEGHVWTFNFKEEMQNLSIPYSGYYKIEAWGAEGASVRYSTSGSRSGWAYGGKGAYSTGTVYLNKGENLKILVGEHREGAGGGGSFVTKLDNTPLVVAGGGGSGGFYNGTRYSTSNGGPGLGIIGSNTGGGSSPLSKSGGGGGGLTGNGSGGQGGYAFINQPARSSDYSGYYYTTFKSTIGGGGGNYYEHDEGIYCMSGGGGGGYSGGSAGRTGLEDKGGKGGTSYRTGTNLAGQDGVRSGHGLVKITLVEITDEGYVLEKLEKKVDETKTETINTKDKVIALEEKINELNNKVGNSKPEIINISWTNNKTLTYSSSEKLNLYVNDVNYTDSELTVKYSINGGSEVETSLIGNYINVNLSPGFNKVIVKVENPQGNKDVKEVYIWKL